MESWQKVVLAILVILIIGLAIYPKFQRDVSLEPHDYEKCRCSVLIPPYAQQIEYNDNCGVSLGTCSDRGCSATFYDISVVDRFGTPPTGVLPSTAIGTCVPA